MNFNVHHNPFGIPKVFVTADGSVSLELEGQGEHYHSVHGAIQESNHVYIQHGFMAVNAATIRILEIGFGTGLNCLLTHEVQKRNKDNTTIRYVALEPFPLAASIYRILNYEEQLEVVSKGILNTLHEAPFNEIIPVSNNFELQKLQVPVQEFKAQAGYFNLIYFDAFGPETQPEMWTFPIFERMHHLLCDGGILVSYCAKGAVKRNLKAAGFHVESLPGPPGKREVTRAIKQISSHP